MKKPLKMTGEIGIGLHHGSQSYESQHKRNIASGEKISFILYEYAVGGCSNVPCTEKSISLHRIPFWGDKRPEAKKRRKRWVDFINTKRAKWEASHVCSMHFTSESFERQYDLKECI